MPALSEDGTRALFYSDGEAEVWDVDRGKRLFRKRIEICGAALSPDGAHAVVTRIAAPAAILDASTGDVAVVLEQLGQPISMALAWRGRRIAIADSDGPAVYVVDLGASGRDVVAIHRVETSHAPTASSVALSASGRHVVSGGRDGSIELVTLP